MTFLASWPASNASPAGCDASPAGCDASPAGCDASPAGCDAFDTERAALAWAQRLTARGVPSVCVYEIDDERIEGAQ